MQQRYISKTTRPLLFYVESALRIIRGEKPGFYIEREKLSWEAISKIQQNCHRLFTKKSYGVEWQRAS